VPLQEPVRILIVLENPSIDGAAKPMLEFAAQAAGRHSSDPPNAPALDISFAVFTRRAPALDNALTQSALASGASIYQINERHALDPRVIAQLSQAVWHSKADIIVTNGAKTHVVMRVASLCRGTGRWVAFHHGNTATSRKFLVYQRIALWSIRRADRVLTPCAAFATQLERDGVPAGRIRIQPMPVRPFPPVPPGVPEQLRRQLELQPETRVILSVGRLSKEKGHADLIRAFARLRDQAALPSICLVLVGDGPELSSLQQLAGSLGVSRMIRFAGFQSNVSHYLSIADLFVLPSHSEGCPNALLEAMAAGVPVVATSVGGVPDIARNERNALLVEGQDIGGIAAGMSRLLTDKALGARLAVSACSVLQTHAPEIYFQSMLRNLGIVAEEPQTPAS